MQITRYSEWDGSVPAVVSGMPNADYHTHASISASGLATISQYSPAHFKHGPVSDSTRPKEIGTAVHEAVLEPHLFEHNYMLTSAPDRRQSEYKEAAKVYGGDRTLTAKEGAHVTGVQEAVWMNPLAAELIGASERELSFFAHDPETGVVVRCRADAFAQAPTPSGMRIGDLKKCADARLDPFTRAVVRYVYDLKAAFYLDVIAWATGESIPTSHYRFIAFEDAPPYAGTVYEMTDDWMARGRRFYREALNRYADCVAMDEWPAYAHSETLTMPIWMEREEEERADEDGIQTGEDDE